MSFDAENAAEFVKNKILEYWGSPDDGKYITKEQIKNLIIENNYEYFDSQVINEIANKAQKILIGSAVSKMASKGILECAWDEEKNSMFFWKKIKNESEHIDGCEKEIDEKITPLTQKLSDLGLRSFENNVLGGWIWIEFANNIQENFSVTSAEMSKL